MKFVMFAIVFVGLLSLFGAYMAWRLLAPARLRRAYNLAVVGAIGCFILATPGIIIARHMGLENGVLDFLAGAGYIGLGFMSWIFTLLVIRDMTLLFAAMARRIKRWFPSTSRGAQPDDLPPDEERRRFLLNSANIGILAGAGLFTGYGMVQAAQLPEVKTVRVPLTGLPPDLAGLRIVQLTDIHVSSTIKRPFVQGVVDAVNQLSPDIITLTGDIVDGSVSHLCHDVDPLRDLRSAYGKFFVTGNHEYYSGVDQWVDKIERLGFTALLNEHRLIQCGEARLLMGGVTDFRGGRFSRLHRSDPLRAIQDAPPSDLKILLAHQPRSIFGAAEAGFDLQLSGHTHGGQFFPWTCFVFLVQPFVLGLHQYRDTKLYVSGGTGYWGPPMRLGASSEITLLELVPAS